MTEFDFVVYRATPAGIMSAISAARLGMKSVIIEPSDYIGGMMTSGLNATDSVDTSVITGLAREFFLRVQAHYHSKFFPVRVESSVAKRIFSEMLSEAGVQVWRRINIVSLNRDVKRVSSAFLSNGRNLSSRWWVDASYEGDLLPKAGISYSLGRESVEEFSESWAGKQKSSSMLPWKAAVRIDPVINGVLRPYVLPPSTSQLGSADSHVQSYCIRPTLTNDPTNMVEIQYVEDFDYSKFDLFRVLGSSLKNAAVTSVWYPRLGMTFKSAYFNLAEIPNGKFDMNSGPIAPINNPALTAGWVDASLEQRERMTREFSRYTMALLHFIKTDLSVPYPVRRFFSSFGLPADEYEESGHLPPMVYVREGRRLRGEKVFTQNDVEKGGAPEAEAICMAKYHLDCKPVYWRAARDFKNVVREGMFFSNEVYKYGLPNWTILPKRDEAENFFSVCAVSASHVAFGSIRMEPTWMETGVASGILAHISNGTEKCLHNISGTEVKEVRSKFF